MSLQPNDRTGSQEAAGRHRDPDVAYEAFFRAGPRRVEIRVHARADGAAWSGWSPAYRPTHVLLLAEALRQRVEAGEAQRLGDADCCGGRSDTWRR
ncbi:hypothetical protein [Streptomyces sp. CB00455]|uniref:hypothetical protein n=1 Tax=Streptomyces sp. CB00455 TaxID=1703927 RepID=UPI00093A180F|nr:hypothetical protein [Streptomyces sp. CB00455]